MAKKIRKLAALIVCTFVALTIVACFNSKEQKGVHTDSYGNQYYTIQIPIGESEEDYFEFERKSPITKMAVGFVGGGQNQFGTSVVYIYSVKGGGYLALTNKNPGRVMYFPKGFDYDSMSRKAGMVAMDTTNYMSIEEAKVYIPALNSK